MTKDKQFPTDLTILRIIIESKRKILLFSVAIAILAGIISFLFKNSYSSTAAILIQTPELQVEGEPPPLNVETLRALVEAASTKWELYSSLKQQSVIDEHFPFKDFSLYLSTQLLSEKNREKTVLPMVQLVATTNSIELSTIIANQWADIVLKKAKKIHTSGVEDLGYFIGNLFGQAELALTSAEKSYTSALLESQLENKKMNLMLVKDSRQRVLTNLLLLREKITQKEAQLKEYSERLTDNEKEGIWLGEIYSRIDPETSTVTPKASEKNPLRELIVNLRKNEHLLAQFEEKSNLQFKEMQLKNKDKQLEQISREIVNTQNRLALLVSQFEELKKNLGGLNPKILLKKAISDDAAWIISLQDSIPSSDLPIMATEEINLVYQELSRDMLAKSAEIKGLEGQIVYYESKGEGLREEVSRLANEISTLRSQRSAFEEAIQRDQKMFQHLANQYNVLRQKKSDIYYEVMELKASLRARELELSKLDQEVSNLEKAIFTWEDKLYSLERTAESRQEIRDSLAARAGEVEMLNVSLQNFSRAGVALLYSAHGDPQKVGPHRVRIILEVFLLGLLVSSAILVISRIAKNQ